MYLRTQNFGGCGPVVYQYLYSPTGEPLGQITDNPSTMGLFAISLPSGTKAYYGGGTSGLWGHADWLGNLRLGSTLNHAGGAHLATYSGGPSGTTVFAHTNWLSTERVRTAMDGSTSQSCTSTPFGDGQSCYGSDASPLHFTGQPHDGESNLEHFWFRKYSSIQGRWMSPDPAGLAAVDLSNPQSLNRYAYALNSPSNYVDPFGLNISGWRVAHPFSRIDDAGAPPFPVLEGWEWEISDPSAADLMLQTLLAHPTKTT